MKEEIECIGCKNYYLYCSRKDKKYVITEQALEAFANEPWISFEDKQISNLIKLLQNHKSVLEKSKANLSAKGQESIIVDKTNAVEEYPIRETSFTKNSRLNHQANLSAKDFGHLKAYEHSGSLDD